jgi:hypothetical protein
VLLFFAVDLGRFCAAEITSTWRIYKMPIFIISIIIQVLLVLHVVKTGRNTTWIWIVVMLPIAGSVAYIIIEVLPDIGGSRTGRAAKRKVVQVLNPDKDINQAASMYSVTDTVENSMKLANECLAKELYEEANQLYKKCLAGVHEHDPDIMYGLAESEYGLSNYAEVKSILDSLIEHNPEYKNPDAHLLYAKSLEQSGDIMQAIEEFEILDSYYSGPEPTYHLAMLIKKQGQEKKAMELLKKIIHKSDISGGHYHRLHKTWINLAKKEYRS